MYVHTNQRLQAVLDSVNDAILMVDRNFKVVMCNKKFETFFGIAPSTIIDQDKREAITKEIMWRVSDPNEFQSKLFWLYDNPDIISHDEIEVEIPRQRILHRFSGPVYNNDGFLLGRVEVYSDITDQKILQKELEIKNNQLFLVNAAATAISESLKIENLGQTFLRRLIQATAARAGILYIKSKDNALTLSAVIGKKNRETTNIPVILKEEHPPVTFWGHIQEESPLLFLKAAFEKGFFIGFPGIDSSESANSLCILIWDNMNEKWLNKQLFKNIGIQLGIGICNASLYEEARRNAILQERDRMAMEMHDGLAQSLGYLGLGIDSIIKRINSSNKEAALELLNQLRQEIDRSYDDVREAIIGLRVDVSKNTGFIKAIGSYLQEFHHLSNIKTTLTVEGECCNLEFERELHIIRIIQEALTNVRRHSQASEAAVKVTFGNQEIEIIVQDKGKGFNKKEARHLPALHQGVRIMNARAAILKGNLGIKSAKGRGTEVILKFPIR